MLLCAVPTITFYTYSCAISIPIAAVAHNKKKQRHPVYVVCVEEWEMLGGDVGGFPSGLAGMRSKLGVPFLYYMPYWCQSKNPYSNSTTYEMLTVEECGWECEYAFVKASQSKQFHVELFNKYKPLGMSNYEQDFMVTNFLKTNLYRTVLGEYQAWAQGLSDAAEATGVPVQFCMYECR